MTTPTGARDRMTAVVREVVGRILPDVPPEKVTGEKHLKDLGADSVDRVEIILGIMDRLGLDEPMSGFSDLPDIDALVDFMLRTGEA